MTRYPTDRKVYVGDLGDSARKNDLEHAFGFYGKLRSVWVARNPPGFAFVEFEDARDAADAVRALDGRTLCGRRARVELSTGRMKSGGGRRGGGDHNRDRGGRVNKCYECGGRGHYARQCRHQGRSRRRSDTRSRSRGRQSHSSQRSVDSSKEARKSRDDYSIKSGENGRSQNGDDTFRYSNERNGSSRKDTSKRHYSDSSRSLSPKRSPQPKRGRSTTQRQVESSVSRSRSGSHTNY